MTYKEWLTLTCQKFGISETEISLILVNQKNNIPNENAVVDVNVAKMALINEFTTLIPLNNVSEGGYSSSWNMDAIKLWYNQTCADLGITPTATQPIIRNKSNIW